MHEIKHDGFRLLACRGAAGVRLLTRNGNDFTARYPLIVAAMAAMLVRSCAWSMERRVRVGLVESSFLIQHTAR
jgi:ATP-dependent DNA ligase